MRTFRDFKRELENNNKKVLPRELKDMALYFKESGILDEESGEINQKLIEMVEKASDQISPFWGFTKGGCDAPPNQNAKAGRANPKGISYLYTSTDEKTAVMEMRSQLGQQYNVCKIETFKKAKLFDFTYIPNDGKENEILKATVLNAISREFSTPNYGETEDYVPTQYLCEFIKKMGYDGIRFRSAVSPNGINIVFFNTDEENKVYDIIESRVGCVSFLDIEIDQTLPIEKPDDNQVLQENI